MNLSRGDKTESSATRELRNAIEKPVIFVLFLKYVNKINAGNMNCVFILLCLC